MTARRFPKGAMTLFHYWLPIAMGWSLALVMQHATGLPLSLDGMVLLLGGIGAAYSFDRLWDAPEKAEPPWVECALAAGTLLFGAAMVAAALAMPPRVLGVAALLSAASLLYSRLKRLPLLKTVAVALVWTWASAALPLAGAERLAWRCWGVDAFLPLFLLVASGCLLCDVKDAGEDRRRNVPSLPALFGPGKTCAVAALLALCGAGLAALQAHWGLSISGAALAALAPFPRLLARRVAGPVLVDSVFLIPGVLIAVGLV